MGELPQVESYFKHARRRHYTEADKSEILEKHIFTDPDEE